MTLSYSRSAFSFRACLTFFADDTPFKYTKTADGARMPPTPGGPKTEMGFVTIKGAKDRKKTDQLAGRWGDVSATPRCMMQARRGAGCRFRNVSVLI